MVVRRCHFVEFCGGRGAGWEKSVQKAGDVKRSATSLDVLASAIDELKGVFFCMCHLLADRKKSIKAEKREVERQGELES